MTVYRWVQQFAPLLIDAARPCRHIPGDRWCVDETYVKVSRRWIYRYRAVGQDGPVIDVLASKYRDLAAGQSKSPPTHPPSSHSTPTRSSYRGVATTV